MGKHSLYANTTGQYNSAIGHDALRSNSTGNYNVGVGAQADYWNGEGSYNTIIGFQAGKGASEHNKSGNVFLGYRAGFNETGSNKLYIANSEIDPPLIYGEFDTGNVGIGTTSPPAKLSVDGDVAISGPLEVAGAVSVNGNVGIGTPIATEKLEVAGNVKVDGSYLDSSADAGTSGQILSSTGSGTDWVSPSPVSDGDWTISDGNMHSTVPGNVGIGTTSPSEVLDVNGNININSVYKIGGATVVSNTGTGNIFVGEGAGVNITTGLYNSAMGVNALADNNEGHRNSAMGNLALSANTTGYNNSAMGSGALLSNTTGFGNSAMGSLALYANEIGNYNSAMGLSALSYNTTGHDNVGLGYRANQWNQEGSRNTIIGSQAGRGTPNHDKSGNVFLGYKAGYNEIGDNKLYIANDSADANVLIYGDFSTGDVGIGTTSPDAKLDVAGTVNATAFVGDGSGLTGIATGDFDWTISDSNMYSIPSGNVGIGTTSPSAKLEVVGDVNGSGSVLWWEQAIILGTHTGLGIGVKGEHEYSGNSGYLGTPDYGVYGDHNSGTYGYIGSYNCGVYGSNRNSGDRGYLGLIGSGVSGWSDSSYGVEGYSPYGYGVHGSSGNGYAVYGSCLNGGWAGYFVGDVHVTGALSAGGTKPFIQPHPKDPSREIVYIAAEAPEAVVLHRGTGHLKEGVAVIELPEHFGLVAADEGIQVQVTPRSADTFGLAVVQRSREEIVVKELKNGRSNFEFDYFVTGVRAGFEGHEPVAANTHFKPRADETAEDFEARYTKDNMSTRAIRSMLISNGILTEDGKLNMVKVNALGWTVAEKDKAPEEHISETHLVARKAGEL
jgi:hypothetical protein